MTSAVVSSRIFVLITFRVRQRHVLADRCLLVFVKPAKIFAGLTKKLSLLFFYLVATQWGLLCVWYPSAFSGFFHW